jgi:hypothetical protein
MVAKDTKEVKPAGLKSYAQLTKNDVMEIWAMRAGGKTNKFIAQKIGCKTWVSSDVITRGAGPQFPIPPDIREAALATVQEKSPRSSGKNRAKPGKTTDLTPEQAIGIFAAACRRYNEAHDACIALGYNEDSLENIDLAIEGRTIPANKK